MSVAGADRTLEVVVHEPPSRRLTLGHALLGPLARHPARFEVRVIDRDTRVIVLRIPINRARTDADALAAVLRDDLHTLDESAFLNKHGRSHRPA